MNDEIRIVPLGELEGLPIGVPKDNGELVKRVSFLPWGWEEEKMLAKIREENPNSTITQYITQVMIRLISLWGPHDFRTMDMAEREIRLRDSFFGDVMTAYIKLRMETLGPDLVLVFTCPLCRENFTWESNLRDLEIQVANNAPSSKELVKRHQLKRPILLGETESSWVEVRPMRWEPAHSAPGDLLGTDDPRFRELAFQDAILGAEGVETHGAMLMVAERLTTLRKVDIERLAALVDGDALGPDISTKLRCRKCRFEFRAIGDWSYANFFGASSLPQH